MKYQDALLKYLFNFVAEERKNIFEAIAENRTRKLTVVLEDIYQSQNASAVLRSCDCFGIQDVHIIENRNEYTINPDVALGSSKWLNLHRYSEKENNTVDCFNKLREKGYKIIATTPHKDDSSPSEISLDQDIALVFGTELRGLSQIAMDNADGFLRIPMYGFTESFNISVSAALCMNVLSDRIRKTDENDWKLSSDEITEIKIDWLKTSIKESYLLMKKFDKEWKDNS